jgi:ABC-2 type transport system permease protein
VWEHRSLYVAPLAVTGLVLFAAAVSLLGLPARMASAPSAEPADRYAAAGRHLDMAPAPIMLVAFLVGAFYALDALYGERRDRSILFWKSLPVPDATAVLAKASIPLLVLPAFALALSLVTVAVLLLPTGAILVAHGASPAPLLTRVRLVEQPVVMAYGLAVHALWFAPLYAWLLLLSAWARRTPILWAVLPPVAVGVVEKVAFGSSHFAALLRYRLSGAMSVAFDVAPRSADAGNIDRLSQLDPLGFASSPGLWSGLAVAAALLAAAVHLRRHREPI